MCVLIFIFKWRDEERKRKKEKLKRKEKKKMENCAKLGCRVGEKKNRLSSLKLSPSLFNFFSHPQLHSNSGSPSPARSIFSLSLASPWLHRHPAVGGDIGEATGSCNAPSYLSLSFSHLSSLPFSSSISMSLSFFLFSLGSGGRRRLDREE